MEYDRSSSASEEPIGFGMRGSTKPPQHSAHNTPKENATFVSLVRNKDLWGMVHSIQQIEDRFNGKFHYDWVFLNEEPFDDEFKEVTSNFVSSKVHYGLIEKDQWTIPPWIDSRKEAAAREEMDKNGVFYGGMLSYHHMCRYESGFFFQHELLKPYKYYWRVEPEVMITCNIEEDVFKVMRENDYSYGFTIAPGENMNTVPTLWNAVKEWRGLNPEFIAKDNLEDFLSDDGGYTYNGAHFWSNFEVGDLDFFRSKEYLSYFEYLDKKGGFYYERWGDAPVHSIGAALLLPKRKIHHFETIGYYHPGYQNCPAQRADRMRLKCTCPYMPFIDYKHKSFNSWSPGGHLRAYYDVAGLEKPDEWEKNPNQVVIYVQG